MTDAGAGPEVGVVVAAGGPFGPVVAVTRGAAVDEAGIDREKVLGIEAETTTAVGEQVGDEHVGLPNQVEQHFAALLGRDVDADAALAPVHDLPHERHVDVRLG